MSTEVKVTHSANRPVGKGVPVNPVDRDLLAAQTRGAPGDYYRAQLKHEKDYIEAVQDGFGRAIARGGKPNPSTADIVAANPRPIEKAVYDILCDLFRTKGGTAVDLPLANGEKNLLWPHLGELLKSPSKYFPDNDWFKKNQSPVKEVVNIGKTIPLAPPAKS